MTYISPSLPISCLSYKNTFSSNDRIIRLQISNQANKQVGNLRSTKTPSHAMQRLQFHDSFPSPSSHPKTSCTSESCTFNSPTSDYHCPPLHLHHTTPWCLETRQPVRRPHLVVLGHLTYYSSPHLYPFLQLLLLLF